MPTSKSTHKPIAGRLSDAAPDGLPGAAQREDRPAPPRDGAVTAGQGESSPIARPSARGKAKAGKLVRRKKRTTVRAKIRSPKGKRFPPQGREQGRSDHYASQTLSRRKYRRDDQGHRVATSQPARISVGHRQTAHRPLAPQRASRWQGSTLPDRLNRRRAMRQKVLRGRTSRARSHQLAL